MLRNYDLDVLELKVKVFIVLGSLPPDEAKADGLYLNAKDQR